MKTTIICVAITFFFITVQTSYGVDYEQSINTEIKFIETIVKFPDGNEKIIKRQIRVPKIKDFDTTFEIDEIIKQYNKLEIHLRSRTDNIITITMFNYDYSNVEFTTKIFIASQQTKKLLLNLSKCETIILLFNTDKGEKLVKKLFVN